MTQVDKNGIVTGIAHMQIHHIWPKTIDEIKELFARASMNVDDKSNLIFLPDSVGKGLYPTSRSMYSSKHHGEYTDFFKEKAKELLYEGAAENWTQEQYRNEIMTITVAIRKRLEEGTIKLTDEKSLLEQIQDRKKSKSLIKKFFHILKFCLGLMLRIIKFIIPIKVSSARDVESFMDGNKGMNLTKEEKTLAQKLKDFYNINWEKYQERFKGTKPLKMNSADDNYPERLQGGFKDLDQILNIGSKYNLKPIGNNVHIEVGFKRKIDPDELKKFKYLDGGLRAPIFQKDIIDKMLEVCPNDFEPVPVTLENWNKKTEPFSIEGFYAINVLKVIKAVDENKTEIDWSENGVPHMQKYWFKENPWQDGCDVLFGPSAPKDTNRYPPKKLDKPCMIAIDALSGTVVWHPKLAKVVPLHPHLFFAHDVEVWKRIFTDV